MLGVCWVNGQAWLDKTFAFRLSSNKRIATKPDW
jgi:hypothetical protein